MDRDSAQGKFEQVKGKIKQSVGESVGDEKLANSGAADQVKGAAREAVGETKDAAHAVADDASAHAETKREEFRQAVVDTAQDVRQKIASTAQNVKDAVTNKKDQRRSA